MKKYFALIALAAITLPSAASSANTRKFHVGAVTVSQSTGNIEPVARADADVVATDDGVNTLTITGQGSGFVPGLSYLSFIYDTGSTAKGPAACLPSTPNPFTSPVMFVAYWLPTNGSHRTLNVIKTGPSYTSLASIGTISIRYDSTPAVSPLIGQTPLRFFLQSCSSL